MRIDRPTDDMAVFPFMATTTPQTTRDRTAVAVFTHTIARFINRRINKYIYTCICTYKYGSCCCRRVVVVPFALAICFKNRFGKKKRKNEKKNKMSVSILACVRRGVREVCRACVPNAHRTARRP